MNCTKCGIKISPSVARQQEGGENLCRGCYLTEKARLNQEAITREHNERELDKHYSRMSEGFINREEK